VEGVHNVCHHDWENSHALNFTDEGLFTDLEEQGSGGAERLVLKADHGHAKEHKK